MFNFNLLKKQKRKGFLVMIFTISCAMSLYSRDMYTPDQNRPLSMILNDSLILNSGVNQNSANGLLPSRTLIKYKISDKTISTLTDPLISETIKGITENTRYVFVAGSEGLTVYDKNTSKWEKWFGDTVNTIICSQDKLWMGTMDGVKELDISTLKTKQYNRKNGLKSDKVYSLCQVNNSLFVGTYRNGKRNRREREYEKDMFGTGLDKIDLSTGKIKRIIVPNCGPDIVLDIYPVLGNPDLLRFVVGCWYVKIYDYSIKQERLIKTNRIHYHLEGAMSKNVRDSSFESYGAILDYMLQVGLANWPSMGAPNPVAFEIIDLLFKRGNFTKIESLLTSKDAHIRQLTYYSMYPIITTQANGYLLNGLHDEDPYVFQSASRILGGRRVPEASPQLRKVFLSKKSDVDSWALDALIQIEPSIAAEIIGRKDAYEIDLLTSVVKTGNYHKVIKAIAGDRQATVRTREIANEILKASKY